MDWAEPLDLFDDPDEVTLTEFLAAQWDKQARAADEASWSWLRTKPVHSDQWHTEKRRGQIEIRTAQGRLVASALADTDATLIVGQDPGTALADIDAKRELAALHTGPGSCPTCDEPLPCQTLRLLGKPFASEIGYQAQWAPR